MPVKKEKKLIEDYTFLDYGEYGERFYCKMTKNRQEEIVCIFCGKHREVTYWEDDGIDFYGHARGHADSGLIDDGCDCEFGRLARNKVSMKPMCLNCGAYKDGFCTNKMQLGKLKGMFDMGDKLKVNKPELKCPYYELNINIFKEVCEENT